MSDNPQDRLQQVISNRPKGASLSAATANVVNFQDWLFFGTAPNVFAQVGVTPVAQTTAIQYVVLVLETQSGLIFSDASIITNNAQAGWTLNIATDTGIYNTSQYGTAVQAWAFAQALVNGQIQEQYSAIQSYTVS